MLDSIVAAVDSVDSIIPASNALYIELAHARKNMQLLPLRSLVPRPHPLREGSGDIGAISWSCTPSRDSIELYVLSHMNAELAQPRNRSNVTRPFSSQRVGSGDEITPCVALGKWPANLENLNLRENRENSTGMLV